MTALPSISLHRIKVYTTHFKDWEICNGGGAHSASGLLVTMGVDGGGNCMRDKILVLNELKKHNNNIQLVSERTGFDKETIRKWAQQKNKVSGAPNKAKKRRGGGGGGGGGGGAAGGGASGTTAAAAPAAKPKPVYIMTVEEKLWECYNKYRDAGHYVTIGRLRDLTCQIIKENDLTDFEYSPEWLKKWLDNYKLVSHRESSSESSSPVGISDSEEREARKKKLVEKEEKKKEREARGEVLSSEDYIFREDEIDAVILNLYFLFLHVCCMFFPVHILRN